MDRTSESMKLGVELDQVLSDILKLACQTSDAEVGYVALVDGDTDELMVRATLGTTLKDLAEGAGLPKGKDIPGWAVAHRKTVLVKEVASDPRRAITGGKDLDFAPRDLVCVPLIAEDRIIGVFTLLNKRVGAFTEEDARLIESVGSLAAIAIHNAKLYEVERRDRRLAQTLSAFSMAITQSLDVGVVLKVLLDYVGRLVPYDKAAAMLVEWDSRFAVRAVRGSDGTAVLDPESPVTYDASVNPVLREMVDQRKGKVVLDMGRDPAWAGYPFVDDMRSWLGIPLVASGQVIGVYSLAKSTPAYYTKEQLRLAGTLASHTKLHSLAN